MAKRGETRPWRVRFEWDNGIKGTETFGSKSDAEDRATKLREYAPLRGATIDVRVEHRDGS